MFICQDSPQWEKGQVMNYDFSNMGDNISKLRRRIGMTQEMLAYRLGVSAQAVSKWERQLSCPDVSLLPTMAEVFGVSIDELFMTGEANHSCQYMEDLPWEDDEKLRIAVFDGKSLILNEIYECPRDQDAVLLIHHSEERRTTLMERHVKGKIKTPPE